ncbi:MAG TPA: outer membrane protein assembly factor BamD [Firmicutes bacterium]|nr:outer membrane protein assembly factor BamD [Bacillota bacterium]
MRYLYLALLVSIITIAGCSSQKLNTPVTASDYYQRGERFLNKKDYLKAIEAFRTITTNFPGSDLVDDAQYGLGEAYFRSGEYSSAISEYEKLSREYPLSGYVEKAQFRIGQCYLRQSLPAQLDQENTYRALERFNRFIQEYPDSDLIPQARQKILQCRTKLAEKDYLNGRLYARLRAFDAALYYYQKVVDQFGETKWSALAQLEIGEILLKQGKKDQALRAFQRALASSSDKKLKKRALQRIKKIGEDQ